jgi:hypothetical protein
MQSKAPELLVAWMMILNKLMRLLFTPYSEDNWKDIAGYAQLVLRFMEETRPARPTEVEETE